MAEKLAAPGGPRAIPEGAIKPWPSSAACCIHHNCIPVLVDIDWDTTNIDADRIAAAVTHRTKAIVAVHLHGHADDAAGLRDRIVWALKAEGAGVGTWQGWPVPQMTAFQAKNAYGRGCPWSCWAGRKRSTQTRLLRPGQGSFFWRGSDAGNIPPPLRPQPAAPPGGGPTRASQRSTASQSSKGRKDLPAGRQVLSARRVRGQIRGAFLFAPYGAVRG